MSTPFEVLDDVIGVPMPQLALAAALSGSGAFVATRTFILTRSAACLSARCSSP